MNPEDYLGII